MSCTKCACFDVCDKLKTLCKQIVFSHINKPVKMNLITAIAQGCSQRVPIKIYHKSVPNSSQLKFGEK